MRRVEHQHNTPEQVKQYLEQALTIVAELEMSDDLRRPCFEKAVDLVAGKQITFEQYVPQGVDLRGALRG